MADMIDHAVALCDDRELSGVAIAVLDDLDGMEDGAIVACASGMAVEMENGELITEALLRDVFDDDPAGYRRYSTLLHVRSIRAARRLLRGRWEGDG